MWWCYKKSIKISFFFFFFALFSNGKQLIIEAWTESLFPSLHSAVVAGATYHFSSATRFYIF